MITIRKALVSDSIEISKMVEKSIYETFPEVYPQDHVTHTIWIYRAEAVKKFIEERYFFVAMDKGKIVGSICIKDDRNFMTGLYILPEYMGKGIAKELVEYIERFSVDRGYKDINLWSTTVADKFYKHLGYTFIRDIEEDGYVKYIEMSKSLT